MTVLQSEYMLQYSVDILTIWEWISQKNMFRHISCQNQRGNVLKKLSGKQLFSWIINVFLLQKQTIYIVNLQSLSDAFQRIACVLCSYVCARERGGGGETHRCGAERLHARCVWESDPGMLQQRPCLYRTISFTASVTHRCLTKHTWQLPHQTSHCWTFKHFLFSKSAWIQKI